MAFPQKAELALAVKLRLASLHTHTPDLQKHWRWQVLNANIGLTAK